MACEAGIRTFKSFPELCNETKHKPNSAIFIVLLYRKSDYKRNSVKI